MQGIFQPIAVGVRDEHLPETIGTDQADQPGYPLMIQFFKNIIQQEEGADFFFFQNNLIFSQFKGKQETFPLALGARSP